MQPWSGSVSPLRYFDGMEVQFQWHDNKWLHIATLQLQWDVAVTQVAKATSYLSCAAVIPSSARNYEAFLLASDSDSWLCPGSVGPASGSSSCPHPQKGSQRAQGHGPKGSCMPRNNNGLLIANCRWAKQDSDTLQDIQPLCEGLGQGRCATPGGLLRDALVGNRPCSSSQHSGLSGSGPTGSRLSIKDRKTNHDSLQTAWVQKWLTQRGNATKDQGVALSETKAELCRNTA